MSFFVVLHKNTHFHSSSGRVWMWTISQNIREWHLVYATHSCNYDYFVFVLLHCRCFFIIIIFFYLENIFIHKTHSLVVTGKHMMCHINRKTRKKTSERWKMINNCDKQGLVDVCLYKCCEKWCLNMLKIFIFSTALYIFCSSRSWRCSLFLSKYGASVIVYLFILCDVDLFLRNKTHKNVAYARLLYNLFEDVNGRFMSFIRHTYQFDHIR